MSSRNALGVSSRNRCAQGRARAIASLVQAIDDAGSLTRAVAFAASEPARMEPHLFS